MNKGKRVHKLKLKWTEYKTKFIIRAETPSDSNITKTWENNRSTSSVRQSQHEVQVSPPPASSSVYFLEEIFSFQFSFLVLCYIALQTYLHINMIHFMKDVCRFVVIAAVRAPESKSNGRVRSLTADQESWVWAVHAEVLLTVVHPACNQVSPMSQSVNQHVDRQWEFTVIHLRSHGHGKSSCKLLRLWSRCRVLHRRMPQRGEPHPQDTFTCLISAQTG